jgi:gas vesicle protein
MTHCEQFTNLMKIVTIELSKVPREDDGQAVWSFLQCFKCQSKEDFEMLMQRHPEVNGIAAQVQTLSFLERHRMIAEAREKWRRDQHAFLSEALESGLSQGREENRAEREQLKQEIEQLREEIARLSNSKF